MRGAETIRVDMNQKTYIAILAGVFLSLALLGGLFIRSIFSAPATQMQSQDVDVASEEYTTPPVPPAPDILYCDDMAGKVIPYPDVKTCRDESGIVVDRALWRRISPATYRTILGLLNPEGDPKRVVSIWNMGGVFLKGGVGSHSGPGGARWIAKKTGPVAWDVIAMYQDNMSCVELDDWQVPRTLEPDCYINE